MRGERVRYPYPQIAKHLDKDQLTAKLEITWQDDYLVGVQGCGCKRRKKWFLFRQSQIVCRDHKVYEDFTCLPDKSN